MSTEAVINALQTLHAATEGITSAPVLESYPTNMGNRALDNAGLGYPMVLTFPGEGAHLGATGAGGKRIRTYQIYLLLQVYDEQAQAINASNLVSFVDLLDAMHTAYIEAGILDTDGDGRAWVMRGAGDIQDSGLVMLNYAGADHYGATYQVNVQEM